MELNGTLGMCGHVHLPAEAVGTAFANKLIHAGKPRRSWSRRRAHRVVRVAADRSLQVDRRTSCKATCRVLRSTERRPRTPCRNRVGALALRRAPGDLLKSLLFLFSLGPH